MSEVTVLGAGGWGIALALAAKEAGNQVSVWSCFQTEVDELKKYREHKKLLPGVKIPDDIEITSDINCAENSDITIIAVPSTVVRQTAARLKNIQCGIVVNVAKGLENKTQETLDKVIRDELPDRRIVILSGPSHAEEVGRQVPTTLVSASEDIAAAEEVQRIMMSKFLRIYTNTDVVGVELGGALKNVIAVAAGVIDGLGHGDNTKAALITRGIAEISRLGVKMGADKDTFVGLSGLGDLIVTCSSEHSRNHRFGVKLGKGEDPKTALEEVGTVEGYYAAEVIHDMSQKYNLEMPICEQCYEVIYKGKSPAQAVYDLMTRPKKDEQDNILWI